MTAGGRRLLAAALLACAAAQGCAASGGSALGPRGAAAPEVPDLDAAGHERLGDIHTGQGDLERAWLEYGEAVRLEPGRLPARYKAARILLRRGLPAQAKAEFAAIVAASPGDALALLGLGHAAFLAGDADAEQRLLESLAADHTLWQAHNLLGLLYDRQGEPAKAATEYYAALTLDPSQGSVANNLGVSLLRAGNAQAAEAAFRHAIDGGCKEAKVFNNLGLALARLGRPDDALEAFRQGGTPAAAWNNLGFALLVEGKAADAAEAFEKAIAAEGGYFRRAHENRKRTLGAQPAPASNLSLAPP